MDSGVCFALFKVTGESGSKLRNKLVSILEISNGVRAYFRSSAQKIHS